MRGGACTVQQVLTTEAASVLKLSVGLARRRGHAQVTPLHVAATLLSSRSSPLRRACLNPHSSTNSHPLQCRALELCFNVALNRLPTSPGPPLHHGQPSLSNALIAALKRAQAHQRRGCVEHQHQQPLQQHQHQQQQPLLAIKVELEQLVISILDDPSVSRVMREAGFSSTSIKNRLEDSVSGFSSPSPPPTSPSLSLFHHSFGGIETHRESFWQTHLLKSPFEQNPVVFPPPCRPTNVCEEDLKLVVEVLLRKQRRRNTVVVGDSLMRTEGLVLELMGRVERGDVPEELKSVHFVKLQLSSLHLKFMRGDELEVKLSELRRKVGSLASGGGGAIVYVGDLKWASESASSPPTPGGVDGCYNNPVELVIAEIGKLVSDFSGCRGKVWLLAIANYQTYMKCQMRHPTLENQWALQAVSVPSGGGLGLSLHSSSDPTDSTPESKPPNTKGEQDKLTCCAECASNYERDALMFNSGLLKPSSLFTSNDTKDICRGSDQLPYWLQQHKTDHHNKDGLVQLRIKWNKLCQSLHHNRPKTGSPSHCISHYSANPIFLTEFASKPIRSASWPPAPDLGSLKEMEDKEVKTVLALGGPLLSDSDKLVDQRREEIQRRLQENLPWQSEATMASITAALLDPSTGKGAAWLLIGGNDWIGQRRLVMAMADALHGSTDRLVCLNMRRREGCLGILLKALKTNPNCVVSMENIEGGDTQFVEFLIDCIKNGTFKDSFGSQVSLSSTAFVLMGGGDSSNSNGPNEEESESVIDMKLETISSEEVATRDLKRTRGWDSPPENHKQRRTEEDPHSENTSGEEGARFSRQSSMNSLDLNALAASEEDEEADGLIRLIERRFVLNAGPAQRDRMAENVEEKIRRSFGEVHDGELCVDRAVVEELMRASGGFVEGVFERWLSEVFQKAVTTVKKGGKVRLTVEGRGGVVLEFGFHGSCLPKSIRS
ncbi:hypothetical protein QJS10_CPA02g01554 [Acorus calamus]|uniref:Clp R domain-containing protein n=1 Tax=Acorus calamus TaxID=4465 RepID=A0AAV9FEE6_ACOCL|nr:hypothetical protein QJS10_CPA02g01554 [Acorus calamus]